MYTKNEILSMTFFDLETATGCAKLEDVPERGRELWSKRCEYLSSRFEENKGKSDSELYLDKAALSPEFNRIVSACFFRPKYDETTNTFSFVERTYSSSNEVEILQKIHALLSHENIKNTRLVGHSIKRFDIPVLCKRMLINGMELPRSLMVHNMKPWEMSFIDTAEAWSFGTWQEGFTSLDLLSYSLGIPSPKEDIKGAEVSRVFWEEGDMSRIDEYCKRDVKTTMNIVLKLSGFPIVE